MAVRLEDQELTDRQQQDAKDFIQKHLYGANCNRTTGKGALYNELRKYIDCVTNYNSVKILLLFQQINIFRLKTRKMQLKQLRSSL